MAEIDYMKVIEITERLFGANKNPSLNAVHEKNDYFDVSFITENGDEIKYRLILFSKFELALVIPRALFTRISFEKWLSKFEFEMEQTFLKNIKIDALEERDAYRVRAIM